MTREVFQHSSVMPEEVLECLRPQPGEVFVDGTVGGGGHARLILEATAPDGLLVGLDRDREALEEAGRQLASFGERVLLRHGNFADATRILAELDIATVDGILLDLGVSSFQLDTARRGFSFQSDAPLDMRMDTSAGMTAADVVNALSPEELARIFREYGEERYARRIARRIEKVRADEPLMTTRQLAELVRDAVPGGHVPSRIHPATRVFQALRIHVNAELDSLREGLRRSLALLKPGGRMAVISFHSLEDRIVKQFFRSEVQTCICPPGLPICACNRKPGVALLTRKGLKASESEIAANPRARSAVLRAIRRL
ncbi:16S rRNA (N4-methyl-C1402)-methyltransferase [Syntrophotalea carbinolica DSM 2380]|uniref:Ribosomal RNA small subunit methyltransferase H n=1 Tax=Syntrophotalea carbinolica (strain DSM 2380 / NBRC 103641 / GraBd1) TaxID=338963 RepID=RSMH_SYNC1|nr:16S rRNA (cytosine(1402)-N(4))-methyltransferase RsmH [Syntrophotalea carbinolica]Q3A2F8.1 RecName: Full=Ribosomal RNA small subunit methyltransferase H; AltName: Full=16S rRNA m(4)C1402 methyltransferase; AltName: Full=rRNA (cytosine-N(4)-)-methyltransferase RsmH [Syntrophotalea carbinolica DSM 2380]ABA89449.1 16S rRNA (N4-methyl-C1402)-methyltransferase [Syntrophotalea carbinolica DSM 2380]